LFQKDICIKCINRNRHLDSDTPFPWDNGDDRSWRVSNVVRCTVRINEMFPISIHDELPEGCFFVLEQLVSGDDADD